jgi:hypothetical protein
MTDDTIKGMEATIDQAIALIDTLRADNAALLATHHAMRRMERLARDGFIISVCYGRAQLTGPLCWSVDVMNGAGESFSKPFVAASFPEAIEIAATEIRRRGWTVQ